MSFYKKMMSAGKVIAGDYVFYPFKQDNDVFLAVVNREAIFSNNQELWANQLTQSRTLEFCKNSFTKNKYYIELVDACVMLYNLSKGEFVFKNRIDYIKKNKRNIERTLVDKEVEGYGVVFNNDWVVCKTIYALGIYAIVLDEKRNLKGIITTDYRFEVFQLWDIEDVVTFEGYEEGMFDFLVKNVTSRINKEEDMPVQNQEISKEDLLKVPHIIDIFIKNYNPKTGFNLRGFDKRKKNFVTGTFYDVNGFAFNGKHKYTHTIFDVNGRTCYGADKHDAYKGGFDGYTVGGFNAVHIHKDTGTKFNSEGLNIDGDTEEVAIKKERDARINSAKETLKKADADIADAQTRRKEALEILKAEGVME